MAAAAKPATPKEYDGVFEYVVFREEECVSLRPYDTESIVFTLTFDEIRSLYEKTNAQEDQWLEL